MNTFVGSCFMEFFQVDDTSISNWSILCEAGCSILEFGECLDPDCRIAEVWDGLGMSEARSENRNITMGHWKEKQKKAAPSENVSSSMCKMHRLRFIPRMRKVSSGLCSLFIPRIRKVSSGLCSLFIHCVVFNDSVSGQ